MKKIIHYCWFGGKPLPKLARKCLKSWKKYFPDYEIIRWDETNFDVNINNFCKQAYEQKKWAFVSDVARCYALKMYGGLYFDTDILVIKNNDDIISHGFVAGWESEYNVAAGVIWVKEPDNTIINEIWKYYCTNDFDIDNLFSFSIPVLLTNILQKKYGLKYGTKENQHLKDDVMIYTQDYFYPIGSNGNRDNFSDNTYMIHYYMGSWLSKDYQLRFKFKQIFGEKRGNFLLNILVVGKKILKIIAKFFLYPYIKNKEKYNLQKKFISNFDIDISKLKQDDYIIFYNKNWLGTSIVTKELFESVIGIDEIHDDSIIKYITDVIIKKNYRLVVFSAFSMGWKKLAEEIKKANPSITIKIIWHGSFAMNSEKYDWLMFKDIFDLYNNKIIKSICFVKKSLYEFYKKKGYTVEFLLNNITISKEEYKKIKNQDDNIKIGLYASGDRWVKNFYNQLAAASIFENAIIECIPLNEKSIIFSKMLGINIIGKNFTISHEKLLKLLSSNDINLYVTFTECAPLLPLESMELGVPCLTGNNHHYWQNTPLEKYLVVNRVDDCIEIYNKAKYCLENKKEIIELYSKWKKEYTKESDISIKKFLEK